MSDERETDAIRVCGGAIDADRADDTVVRTNRRPRSSAGNARAAHRSVSAHEEFVGRDACEARPGIGHFGRWCGPGFRYARAWLRLRVQKSSTLVEIAGQHVAEIAALLPAAGGLAGRQLRRAVIRHAALVGGILGLAARNTGVERTAACCGLSRREQRQGKHKGEGSRGNDFGHNGSPGNELILTGLQYPDFNRAR